MLCFNVFLISDKKCSRTKLQDTLQKAQGNCISGSKGLPIEDNRANYQWESKLAAACSSSDLFDLLTN